MSSGPVWSYLVTHTGSVFLLFVCLTYFYTYMTGMLMYNPEEAANFIVIINVTFFITSNISGTIYDRLVATKTCSSSFARKAGNTIGCASVCVLFAILLFLGRKQRDIAVLILILISTFQAIPFGCGFYYSTSELAPQHTGVLMGISGTLTVLTWVFPLRLADALTQNQTKTGWQIKFAILLVINAICAMTFAIYGSTDVQQWAVVPKDGSRVKSLIMNVRTIDEVESDMAECVQTQGEAKQVTPISNTYIREEPTRRMEKEEFCTAGINGSNDISHTS